MFAAYTKSMGQMNKQFNLIASQLIVFVHELLS